MAVSSTRHTAQESACAPKLIREAMRQAGTYPHPVNDVQHLETHISDVFLAGDFAYKIKKPLDLGFLDFSTLAQRRAACRTEVELNRRLAPDVYLDVVALTMHAGGVRLAPENSAGACEYAVQMRRLPADGMLDRVADAGQLSADHVVDIARQLVDFHRHAQRSERINQDGGHTSLLAAARQNFEQTERFRDLSIDARQFNRLKAHHIDFLVSHETQFADRARAGHIVDGHGDLHLRNMCLDQGRVIIFDCIEFNAALRAGDVLNDIAFLTMDLDARRLEGLSNIFLNEYLMRRGDYTGLDLFDFFQSYRATVRGKVQSLRLDQDLSATDHGRTVAEARAYFDLAERYTHPRTGGVLITSGLSGSGKTTAARAIAKQIGAIVVRSDAVRKQLAGLSLDRSARSEYGQGIYSTEMGERTYAAMLAHAEQIVNAGRWAILDAGFATRRRRQTAADLAACHSVAFGIVYCELEESTRRTRVTQRTAQASDLSDADVSILDAQGRDFEAPAPGEGAVHRWDQGAGFNEWWTDLRPEPVQD